MLENSTVGSLELFDKTLDREIPEDKRAVVLLDEISWMAYYDKTFPEVLKTAWDDLFKKHSKLVLVLCGSVSMWIKENIIDNGAFAGRRSYDFLVPELPLSDCRAFWGRKAERTALREIIDVLSVTGGVPKYLQEIDPSLPADENVKRMCFTPEGYLFKDFNTIFGDVFGAAAAKRRILLALANGSASVSELAEKFEREPNGHLSEDLRDLTAAGFVASSAGKNPETGSDVREVRYRLRDNYTRFYLKFIAPKAEAIGEGLFRFTTLDRLPGWESIMGLQFENLVLNNLKKLCSLIGLDGRLVTSAAPYVRRPGKTTPGVQIDLLVQTPKSVYLVEIKRRARISSAIEDEVQEKVRRLRVPRGTSVRTVLVYDGTIAPEVEENGYFDYLVPLESFFN